MSLALGGGIAAWSLTGRRPSILGALAGGAPVFRGGLSGNCSVYHALGASNMAWRRGFSQSVMKAGAGERVEVEVSINRPVVGDLPLLAAVREPAPLHDASDFGEVRRGAATRSHWAARGPLGLRRGVGRRHHHRHAQRVDLVEVRRARRRGRDGVRTLRDGVGRPGDDRAGVNSEVQPAGRQGRIRGAGQTVRPGSRRRRSARTLNNLKRLLERSPAAGNGQKSQAQPVAASATY